MAEFLAETQEEQPFLISRRKFISGGVAATALFLASCEKGQPVETFAKGPSWQVDFAKHPNGSPDPNQWNIKLGPDNFDGAGLQLYTAHPENVVVQDGRLHIIGRQQRMSGRGYTSGRIDTRNHTDFGYGRLVVRARMPRGVGPHAAIWMRHTGEAYGEIDIAEAVGVNGDKTYPNAHTPDTIAGRSGGLIPSGPGFEVPDMSEDFVDYGLDRTDAGLSFRVNGTTIHHIKPASGDNHAWPFGAEDRYYLILNMAIGDRWGGKNGVDASTAPWRMEVESIKFFPPLPSK